MLVTVWNEGDRIRRQLRLMQPQLAQVDLVLCDRYSDDGSLDLGFLRSVNVTALLRTRERGLGCALRMGLAHAMQQGYEGVVTMDGNNKDGVEAIERVVAALERGFDFVQASRFLPGGEHENTPWERYVGVRYVISPILALGAGVRYSDPTNGLKGLRRGFLLDPRVQPFRNVFREFNLQYYLNYRAAKLGFETTEVPARRSYPSSGDTPTKIAGVRARFWILWELLLTSAGRYDPPRPGAGAR